MKRHIALLLAFILCLGSFGFRAVGVGAESNLFDAEAKTESPSYPTFTMTIYENFDGTFSAVATIPAGIQSGKIIVTTSDELDIVPGSLTADVPSAVLNENYERGGVKGACVSFASLTYSEKDVVAFSATYTVADGAVINADDFSVPVWNLIANSVKVGSEADGDIVKDCVFIDGPGLEPSSVDIVSSEDVYSSYDPIISVDVYTSDEPIFSDDSYTSYDPIVSDDVTPSSDDIIIPEESNNTTDENEYVTYTLIVTDNIDGTITVVAIVPENIQSGKIVVSVSSDLTLVPGSLTADVNGATLNENYNRNGIVGATVSFAALTPNAEGTVAFSAVYRIAAGAIVQKSDITVPVWNLISNGVKIASEADGDVNILFTPGPGGVPDYSSEDVITPDVTVSSSDNEETSDYIEDSSYYPVVSDEEESSFEDENTSEGNVGADVTYTMTITENGDGTVTVRAFLPADIQSGKIIVSVSADLVLVPDTLDAIAMGATLNENYNRDGVVGACVAFAALASIPEGTLAFEAVYNVADGATIDESDVTVPVWNLVSNGIKVGSNETCDVNKTFIPFIPDEDSSFDIEISDYNESFDSIDASEELSVEIDSSEDVPTDEDSTENSSVAGDSPEDSSTDSDLITYNVTLVENGDGTVTVTAAVPENVDSGKIVIVVNSNLTYVPGSLDSDMSSAISNENYNRDGIKGVCVSFAQLRNSPAGTIALVAKYTVAEGYVASLSDIEVPLWNLASANVRLASQADGDVNKSVKHCFADKFGYNEDGHWAICTVCNEKGEAAEHTFDNACDTDCNVCGVYRETEHTYDADNWFYDDDDHWHVCDECGDSLDIIGHIYDNACDPHCNVCGVLRYVRHAYDPDEWFTDDDNHWHQCDVCGTPENYGQHSFDNACDTDCNVCGVYRETEHTYDADNWFYDDDNHWHVCDECGDSLDIIGHIYDNACDPHCNVCGVLRYVRHAYDPDEWFTDDDNHWHQCDVCGAPANYDQHSFDNDRDADCNTCGHTREIEGILGDLNGDGLVDNIDAARILKFDAGIIDLTEFELLIGDINFDGLTDNIDAARILKYDAGIIDRI